METEGRNNLKDYLPSDISNTSYEAKITNVSNEIVTEAQKTDASYSYNVSKNGNIGNQAIAVMDNWAVLEEVEKDIAAEFFYQTKMIKTIMDQNVLFKSLCQSAKEKIERLEKACENGNV